MDDLVKSVKAQLYDRVSSPLLASFFISWLAWNHRLFIVLASSEFKVGQKFHYVDNFLYPGVYQVVCQGFLWPLLSALVILIVYPVPGRWVYEYVRKEQKRLKEIQQRIEDETPITQEEARELRLIVRTAAKSHDEQIRERDSEISALKKELAETKIDVAAAPALPSTAESEKQPEEPSIKTSDSQTKILKAISSKDHVADWWLRANFEASADLAKYMYDIDRLSDQRLIQSYVDDNEVRYKGTPRGRAHLIRLNSVDELL